MLDYSVQPMTAVLAEGKFGDTEVRMWRQETGGEQLRARAGAGTPVCVCVCVWGVRLVCTGGVACFLRGGGGSQA